ncbi:MAG: M20/M25/M40 family metallo-hydrolase [Acidobacteriota bacterium]
MHIERTIFSLLLALKLSAPLDRQARAADLRTDIDTYVETHGEKIISELVEALSIPSVAADKEHIRQKAGLLRRMLARRRLAADLLETDGNPLVYGELQVPGAARTLLFYCHYDGQPVDLSRWDQEDPFRPVLRDGKLDEGARILDLSTVTRFEPQWRLYARSASDDTSPIVALLAALDALRSMGTPLTSNIRVILDGEEETGSPSLTPAIERYRHRLQADLMIILDGPIHPSARPTVVFGARGILTLELTVYGPKFSLHSGHYGNWAPNPAVGLVRLLASMKDDDGRTVIEGFYDGVELTTEEHHVLDSVPDDHEALKEFFGFSKPDRVGRSLQEAIQYPSLNIRGLESGWVGSEARTIIPDQATAAVDVRLVKETDRDGMFQKVLAHIRRQGFHVVEEDPDDATRKLHAKIVKVVRGAGSNAYRTALDDPHAERLVRSLTEMWGQSPVRIRTSGGTVPIAPFIRALGFPAVSVPTVNFDNNQHSPNENLRLGHFFRAIVTIAAVLTMGP